MATLTGDLAIYAIGAGPEPQIRSEVDGVLINGHPVSKVVRAVSRRRAGRLADAASVSVRRWFGGGVEVGRSSGDGRLELITRYEPG